LGHITLSKRSCQRRPGPRFPGIAHTLGTLDRVRAGKLRALYRPTVGTQVMPRWAR
jgi:hypothetical protein